MAERNEDTAFSTMLILLCIYFQYPTRSWLQFQFHFPVTSTHTQGNSIYNRASFMSESNMSWVKQLAYNLVNQQLTKPLVKSHLHVAFTLYTLNNTHSVSIHTMCFVHMENSSVSVHAREQQYKSTSAVWIHPKNRRSTTGLSKDKLYCGSLGEMEKNILPKQLFFPSPQLWKSLCCQTQRSRVGTRAGQERGAGPLSPGEQIPCRGWEWLLQDSISTDAQLRPNCW